MCGIVGQVNFEGKPVDPVLLAKMRDTLAKRGPDDSGIHIDENVGLGFRRLSIIDLTKAGRQPMRNEDGSIWLVFNGEFYNYAEYREELIRRGHVFMSSSDTEVLLHLYEEYGIDCLERVNGMFALAIYDSKHNKIYLARDRFGVKPLYYHLDKDKLIFASELKAILANGEVGRELDMTSLADYFTAGYILAPDTIFKQTFKLEPATYLCFDMKSCRIKEKQRYWRLNVEPATGMGADEWQPRFEEALRDAVRLRLVSDVPVGLFLSGGIDSTAVLSMASRFKGEGLQTFSIGFKDATYDESVYSRKAAARYHSKYHHEYVEPEVMQILPELARCLDEPMDDSSAVPTYYLSRCTGQKVKAALSGDGGDELLAGYRIYADLMRYHASMDFLPDRIRKIMFSSAGSLAPGYKNRHRLHLLSLPFVEAFQEQMANFNQQSIRKLFKKGTDQNLSRLDFRNYSPPTPADPVSRLQYIDSQAYLTGDILVKIDRTSMANSLEVRSPFLDYRLWELVFSLPTASRYSNGQGKILLKNFLRKDFGKDFINRKKMGFSLPLAGWFRGKLRPFVYDNLNSRRFQNRGLFDQGEVNRLMDQHFRGARDNSRKLWSLLFFEYWCRHWLDK